ncbi:MAG: HAMP domain-containing histidine kinase [Alphaproteobacteria bacterium]|nr:HAMP domain-containing histidine kinase [Alphaproteobacteria bacterium]
MPPPSLLHSSVFRLTLAYAGAFGGSVLLLVAFLYVRIGDVLETEADEAIVAEATGLSQAYEADGMPGLAAELNRRLNGPQGRNTLYLLADGGGRTLIGNISTWPDEIERDGPWVMFDLTRIEDGGASRAEARARVFDLAAGHRLLVGRDLRERVALEGAMVEALAWALGATALLGVTGGYLLARRVLRRIATIERTAATIVRGDLGRRIPLRGRGDEFDQLGARLNDMLAEIERLMGAMREVGDNVAHDLRRPLTRLKGRLETALRTMGEAAAGRADVEAAVEETDSVIATFNALLAIARAEAATPEAMEDLDLATIAEDAVELYRPLAERKAIDLAIEAPTPVRLRGHRHLLAQAAVNLLDNAIKYGPEHGRVVVAVAARGDGATLTVADNGPGIPESDHARAVERFVRLDASRSTPGSGLGLSLVATVARLHRGALCLEDNAPGLRAILALPNL